MSRSVLDFFSLHSSQPSEDPRHGQKNGQLSPFLRIIHRKKTPHHCTLSSFLYAYKRDDMPPVGSSADWGRDSDGGFSNRTFERNSQYSEELLRHSGKFFRVRYIGKMQILASMRTMQFEDRASVAKECISRVCEEAGMTTPSKKRRTAQWLRKFGCDVVQGNYFSGPLPAGEIPYVASHPTWAAD